MGMFDHIPSASPAASGGGMFDHIPALAAETKDPLYRGELAQAKAALVQPPLPGASGYIEARPTAEQAAVEGVQHQRGQEAEQAAFDATRTPGKRLVDTSSFALSLPVRMATRGEYGLGDAFGLVSKDAGANTKQAERDFAVANQSGLETAAAAGDVMAGIPFLNTMGAVPGQVLRTGAAAAGNTPRMLSRLLRDDRAAGINPLDPPKAPPSGPIEAPIAQNRLLTPREPARMPNRGETFAASDELKQGLGATVDISEMIADKTLHQRAAGLKTMPHIGDPITNMYEKGLRQLETATKAAGDTLGTPVGREAAGEGLKQGALGWISKNSKEHLESLYEPVYSKIDPVATRPLTATRKLASNLIDEMKEGTTKSEAQALGMIEEGVGRKEGLTVKGLARKRSEVGDALDESVINKSPGQRALKRAYGALTEDLRASIRQHGGDEALAAWDTANREARVVSIQRKRLAKIVGTDENKLSGSDVFNKAVAIGQERTGNSRAIDTLLDVVGEKQRGDFAAQIIDHMGMNPKTELYSADRFLSEYGKMADYAKRRYFGDAKPHLDNIATIAKKFGEFSSNFNRSNTGMALATQRMLKVLTNPTATIGAASAAMYVNPALAVGGLAAQGLALKAGRSYAWSLAKPSSARQASRVFRETYRLAAAKAAGQSAEAVAKREEGLSQSIRAFSMEAARQTGAKASDIEANVSKQIQEAQGTWTSKTISVDEMEAAIIELTTSPDGASMADLRKKFPDVSKAEFNRTLKEMRDTGRIDLGKRPKP